MPVPWSVWDWDHMFACPFCALPGCISTHQVAQGLQPLVGLATLLRQRVDQLNDCQAIARGQGVLATPPATRAALSPVVQAQGEVWGGRLGREIRSAQCQQVDQNYCGKW